ncbi:MAG TPA: phosphoribosylformylglycinamidine cyclo-ligase [Firmicutes bacterium]|jgi:phosphoribosylformylglycinamidine cyclo-ligase|nr:phosphoribosylformylglycinamidine cyclo-ligase [Bacillota bacterium]
MGLNYKDSGVNIDAGNEAVRRMKAHVRATYTPLVRGDLGSFGGLFSFPTAEYKKPILVASTDGVGTKLKIAVAMGKHDTIGYDLVSHCINDILVQGATPLFFLDYIGLGKLDPEVVEEIVSGLAAGCREGGCALIGGETAEMPGIYAPGDYDLVGTIIGVVEEEDLLPKATIAPGDLLYGLASVGLHTNGYTLARKIFFDLYRGTVDTYLPELGRTIGEELLAPHRCYAPLLKQALARGLVKGLAHLTGGSFIENIPRILPANCRAEINKGSWPVLPVFKLLAGIGDVPEDEMYRTFNMGIGMVCVVAPEDQAEFEAALTTAGEKIYRIGRITAGETGVSLV